MCSYREPAFTTSVTLVVAWPLSTAATLILSNAVASPLLPVIETSFVAVVFAASMVDGEPGFHERREKLDVTKTE